MPDTVIYNAQGSGWPYYSMIEAASKRTTLEGALESAHSYHPMTMDYMVEFGRANEALRQIKIVWAAGNLLAIR